MKKQTGERARELFNSGWYCAESVLRALAEAGGRYEPGMERLVSGFCSGTSRANGLCGAVAGGIVGIGLYAGRTAPSPQQEQDVPYAVVQDFLERFLSEWKSDNCSELTGCDFTRAEGHRKFKEENIGERCRLICRSAGAAALEALEDAGLGPLASIEQEVAPCGLSCGKCLAFGDGEIKRHASMLKEALGENFAAYAERFAGMNPAFEGYGQFREMLDFLASGSCSGCRGQGCLFGDCPVKDCVRQHGVRYCFECGKFPCDEHGLPEFLAERWQSNNERMRDKGLAVYALELRGRHRYP